MTSDADPETLANGGKGTFVSVVDPPEAALVGDGTNKGSVAWGRVKFNQLAQMATKSPRTPKTYGPWTLRICPARMSELRIRLEVVVRQGFDEFHVVFGARHALNQRLGGIADIHAGAARGAGDHLRIHAPHEPHALGDIRAEQ